MTEQPTIIWQTSNTPNALTTYEAYKAIDEMASVHPARLIFAGGDREDRDQLARYAQRRHLAPAMRMPSHADRRDITRMVANGVNRMMFRIDGTRREQHDAIHGAASFGMTLRAMRFATDQHIAIEVETLLTKGIVRELAKIAEMIEAFHASEWLVTFPTAPLSASDDMMTADEAETALAALALAGLRSNLRICTIEAPHFIRFGGSPIRDVIFIAANGEVRAGEHANIVAGSVRYRPLLALTASDAFRTLRDPENLRGKCGRCEFRSPCGGSRARAFAMTGALFAADPLCSYQPSDS